MRSPRRLRDRLRHLLHHFTTDKGALMKGKRVVQINDTVTEVAKNYHPDAALVADAGLTADNIVWWLDEAEIPRQRFHRRTGHGRN
jgi:acetolactate synthase-1/2/3 large subunit